MKRWWGFVSLAVGALVVSSCGYQGPSATPPPGGANGPHGECCAVIDHGGGTAVGAGAERGPWPRLKFR